MLFAEFDMEVELAAEWEAGWEKGREAGREANMKAVARNALAEGLPVEVVRKITGLDPETLTQLASQQPSFPEA